MRARIERCWILAIACLLAVAGAAGAGPPADVTYQGWLLDSEGDPVAGPVEIEIGVWDQPTGGTQLYGETHLGVALVDGVFNLLLGTGTVLEGSFDAALFAAENRYLQVIVDAEVLDPRQPFSSVAYALQSGESDAATYAATAGDADTVDGSHAASLDQSAHLSDTGNPHGVTAAQVGAVTSSQLASHAGDPSAHHTKTTTFTELTGQATDAQIPNNITVDLAATAANADTVDGFHASAFSTAVHNHDDRYYTKAQVDALESRIQALETLLANVTRSRNDITFAGLNLHIVNGTGTTNGAVNGLGNLIVGYNELRATGNNRTGSHNLVVGNLQNYSSYGGLVAGRNNTLSGSYASVSGGYGNTAGNTYASVSGGVSNSANGSGSSVGGGYLNSADGLRSSASGGYANTAAGAYSSVSGGSNNDVTADGSYASVSGGANNVASGHYATVSGGRHNVASGSSSSVTGGGGADNYDGNVAFADYSAILGGRNNLAGDGNCAIDSGAGRVVCTGGSDHSIGPRATVSGGSLNTAIAESASVSGGYLNEARGSRSNISGGEINEASGENSSISGGYHSEASGENSSISGGSNNTASHTYASVSGGSNNTASGDYASVSGGYHSEASGENSSISGGSNNTASHTYASVSGGSYNTASGDVSSVSGGRNNTASAYSSSVSGGRYNEASGYYSSVAGGGADDAAWGNQAAGAFSAVSGGYLNEANGGWSSVSGGFDRSVSGSYDWRAGTLFETQ